MLERGTAAKFATSVFYEAFNDIDIYIEDTALGYDKIFAKLLSRASRGNINIERVFPLGSRDKVIDAAKNFNDDERSRKSIFIIDGDLYLLCGEPYKLPENIIVLPRYCVENFLFDERAILEILDEDDFKNNSADLGQRFNYKNWFANADVILRPLFSIFAASHILQSGLITIKRGSKSICKNSVGDIDAEKVKNIYLEIHGELSRKYGLVRVESILEKIKKEIGKGKCFVSTYVSGKDFILPLLFIRIKEITGNNTSGIHLKMRLANKCDTSPLNPISERLKIMKSQDHKINC